MKVHKLLDFVISLVLWILIGVLVLPLVLILFLYKSLVILVARRVDKNLHPTDPNDTYFAMGDATQVPIVNVAQIWRVEGIISLEEFKSHFSSLFLSCPESRKNYLNLYCYLERFGGYVFKRSVDTIDLDKHIVLRDMSDQDEGKSTLESFLVKLMLKEKFPEGRPLWEISILHLPLNDAESHETHERTRSNEFTNEMNHFDYENDNDQGCNADGDSAINIMNRNKNQIKMMSGDNNLEGKYETVVILKCHHCLTDGYGFIHIVDKLTGNSAPYLVVEEEENMFQKIKASFYGPKTLMDYVINVARTPDLFYPLKDRQNAKWYMSLNTLDVDKLKAVRRRTKTHFISVMMSVTIGALRRHLRENCPERGDSIPSHIWTANSLPWPNHPRDKLVNHWSGGVFQVPFRTDDALERLYGTEQFFKYFHDMQMHKTVKRLIIPVTWCLPSALLRWGHSLDLYYFRYSNAFASLLLSEKPYYLMGRRVKQLYLPLGIKDAVSTSVLFGVSSSHSGQLDLSLLSSSEVVADQAALDKIANFYFAQELEQLCHSAEERIIPVLGEVKKQTNSEDALAHNGVRQV